MGRRGKRKKPGVNELRRKFFQNLQLIKRVLKKRKKWYGAITIYAIDQSMARTGMAKYWILEKSFESLSYKNMKGNTYSRLWNLGQWIENNVQLNEALLVVFEGYAHGATHKREILGEVGYVVKSRFFELTKSDRNLDDRFVPCIIIPPTSLKKFVSGRGNGVDKKEMHKIITEEWGAKTKNHDESDAYALAVIAKNIYEISKAYKHPKNFDSLDDKQIKKMYDEFFAQKTKLDKSRVQIISNIIALDGENIERFRIDPDKYWLRNED